MKLRRWQVKLGIAGAFIALLLEEWFLGAGKWAFTMAFRGWSLVAGLSVGYFASLLLLVVVAFALVLVGLAFWETRPSHKLLNQPPKPLALTELDREAVPRIRGMWVHDDGATSAQSLISLWEAVVEGLMGHYWANPNRLNLLGPIRDRYMKAARELEEALDINAADATLDTAIARFNDFYGAYLRMCEVLYAIHCADVPLTGEAFVKKYQRWELCNRRFRKALLLLTEFPGINRRLGIFPVYPTDSFRFIGAYPWESNPPPILSDDEARSGLPTS